MPTIGNQPLTQSDYDGFLTDLAPFLKMGETLFGAIVDAGLVRHKTAIYERYRLKDDFAEKIDLWRSYPGKIANNILMRRLFIVDEKVKQGLPISELEMKDVRFVAEKHRSSQTYFVSRQEIAQEQDVSSILDCLEKPNETDYVKLGRQVSESSQNPEVITSTGDQSQNAITQ